MSKKLSLKSKNGRFDGALEPLSPIKLDLSFGDPAQGFIRPNGINPAVPPWNIKDASAIEAFSAYTLCVVPGPKRVEWMDELWRVLAPGAKATIVVPYWTSARATADPFMEWPPFSEQSFLYFNKQFRETNKWNRPAKCDFDFVYGYTFDPETSLKSDEVRPFWAKHYANAIMDLQVVLSKRG